jgi:Ca2+-binding RTX toxin-like protein
MEKAQRSLGVACVVALCLMALPAWAVEPMIGGPGDDHIRGGNGPDIILGMAGDDVLTGNNGPDVVKGGPGDDIVWTGRSGPGDKGYGGSGNDVINNFGSGAAPGLLVGGPGQDTCRGGRHDTYRGCEEIILVEHRPHR